MSEYIIRVDENDERWGYVGQQYTHFFGYPITEEIVRCRDCKHANISSFGFCKYCEKFVLPDQDGFGPDPQVNLPLDFFCAYGERREDA